jgi:NADPH-dependent curcumin reductase CurA
MEETNREIALARRPEGVPDGDCFELRETEVPTPEAGEVLVRTRYLSVDPYMRGRMRDAESYAEPWAVGEGMEAGVVGDVIESNHDRWESGDVVLGNLRWADYTATNGGNLTPVDTDLASPSTCLGVLGMPGRTAYFGLLDAGDPSPGETVVVSGAAGAVGSVVVQIAKRAGCRVVGFADTDEKIDYLEEDLGADAGIDYTETDDYRDALNGAAPEGVDVYFDNVGGPITDAAFARLNDDGRVVVCGQISQYNDEETASGPRKLGGLVGNRATVEGILVWDYAPRFEWATERLAEWVASGELTYRETVTEGLENAPDAFLGLFEGENVGKQVVRVADPANPDD